MNGSNRISDIKELYRLLDVLMRTHSRQLLSECSADDVPSLGVYFFYECGEYQSDTDDTDTPRLRIVRVGTHALKTGSKATLWNRLCAHKSGNKNSSVFRKLVGFALEEKEESKRPLNERVTETLGNMWVLCLPIEDEVGPSSSRGLIERNAIALLSNYHKQPIDPPSEDWLGHHCVRPKVQESGLWNQRHVKDIYDSRFLDTLEDLIINPKGTTSSGGLVSD